VWAASPDHIPADAIALPSFEEVSADTPEGRQAYARSFKIQYQHSDPWSARRLAEPCGERVIIQEPPAFPLSREALDRVYALPFSREWHPMYEAAGGVPALSEVKFSLLSSRGCFGGCSFCSLTFHEGRVVTSRSIDSILKEAEALIKKPDFKGYIHDVGGPTANFRVPACAKMEQRGACTNRLCLAPAPCPHLKPDHREYRELLARLRAIPGVKRVFIRSGIRYDYVMLDGDRAFLRDLVEYHVSGQLKVAPEHVSDTVLKLMGKPPHEVFDHFAEAYRHLNAELGKKQYLVPYFISGHPGATLEHALELALYLKKFGFIPDQVQDFYPTPGTLSTAMWYTGLNPLDGSAVYVARGDHERALQRALLQCNKPEHHRRAREALTLLGRTDLIGLRPDCLVPPESRTEIRKSAPASRSRNAKGKPPIGRRSHPGQHRTRSEEASSQLG
ncbi:MAG: YgiQ family radical SAM protein, partial [Rectinema sp.]|nr:YgiQ family radical SAM protein [Rectinema sp.]